MDKKRLHNKINKSVLIEWINQSTSGKALNILTIYSNISLDPSLNTENFIRNILYGSTKADLNKTFKQISVMFARKNQDKFSIINRNRVN